MLCRQILRCQHAAISLCIHGTTFWTDSSTLVFLAFGAIFSASVFGLAGSAAGLGGCCFGGSAVVPADGRGVVSPLLALAASGFPAVGFGLSVAVDTFFLFLFFFLFFELDEDAEVAFGMY